MAVVGSTPDMYRAPEPTLPPEDVLAGTARCGVNAVVTDDSQLHGVVPSHSGWCCLIAGPPMLAHYFITRFVRKPQGHLGATIAEHIDSLRR